MFQPVCLISASDISREGLSNILNAEGFSVIERLEHVSDLEAGKCQSGMLFILDSPPLAQQCADVEAIQAVTDKPVVVVLTEVFDLQSMVACFRAGAQGYIVKSIKALPLMAALKLAAMGERVLPSNLVDVLDRRLSIPRPPAAADASVEAANLSPRELDVLCCLIAGFSNKVIARELSVCEATVKVHVKAILRKLKVNNRTQAAIWASSRGISSPIISGVQQASLAAA